MGQKGWVSTNKIYRQIDKKGKKATFSHTMVYHCYSLSLPIEGKKTDVWISLPLAHQTYQRLFTIVIQIAKYAICRNLWLLFNDHTIHLIVVFNEKLRPLILPKRASLCLKTMALMVVCSSLPSVTFLHYIGVPVVISWSHIRVHSWRSIN